MLIPDKRQFAKGFVMAVIFLAILYYMFTPSFDGDNAFKASDKLFNSIAKGSTNYFPMLKEELAPFTSSSVDVSLELEDPAMNKHAEKILSVAGAKVRVDGHKIGVKGNLGKIINAALKDSEDMFYNKGSAVSGRYGIPEKEALFAWWQILGATVKAFNNQKRFKEAAMIDEVLARGVGVGYNFYKIEPEKASTKAGVLSFALIFYIFYTLWWGFAIFFMAEGLGLQLTGGHKKES
jgi:hypothetical protein